MNPLQRQTRTDVGTVVFDTALGWVAVAWSGEGLVAVTLPRATEAQALGQISPGSPARVPAPPTGLDIPELVDRVRRYYRGQAVEFDEPLDPALGTGFQKRVWAIAREIPRGQTRTYGEIARRAGSPGAARAVGQAMAHNPWPPIVPCHRVVGHSGSLTGFGGGLPMKRAMLEMEGALPPSEI